MSAPTSPSPTPLLIKPVAPPGRPTVTVPASETAVFGRATHCHVQLDDRHASKEHAQLCWVDDAWRVTDLESHNGTYINRWKLTPKEPVIVRDGDELSIGAARFELCLEPDRTPEQLSATYATRASIFVRLRDGGGPEHETAWAEFRDRYAPVIVGFSRNAGLPAQDADDVLQDVMLGFFKRAADFEYDPDKGRFRGYLKRATLNAIRKRARARTPGTVPDDQLAERPEPDDDADPGWETCWAEQMLARAIDEARQRFDERTFEAFELYALRGLDAEAVAERLQMSVNGVHQAKSRVTRLIRSIVDRLRADEG